MEQFTIEESMDIVLSELAKHIRLDSGTLQNTIGVNHFSNLYDMLITLKDDGYVKEESNNGYGTNLYYAITNTGKIFLKDGGYVAKKEKEINSYKIASEALSISKQSLLWSKIAGITGIIAVILAILAMNNH